MGLVRDGLRPHGEPQAVPEHRAEGHGWSLVCATTASGCAVEGERLRCACGRGERREDTFRPGAQGGLNQGAVQLALDMVHRCGAGGLVRRKAPDTRQLRIVITAPLGHRAVTSVATPHGDAHAGEHGRQGMPPATCRARVRNFMYGRAPGTPLEFHDRISYHPQVD